MKKKLLIILWIFLFSFNFSLAQDVAQLILFYWATCPHCKAEEWYLETLKETYDFEVVWYEVYYSKENQEKMKEYGDKFWTEFNGVPVVIMWDDYFLWASYDKTVALLDKYATKKWDSECLPEEDEENKNSNPIVDCTDEENTGNNENSNNNENNQNTSPIPTVSTGTEESGISTWEVETETWDIVETWNVIDDENEDQTTKIFWKEISLDKAWPILFGIALWFADGINPCMFWVLIFLLTYLVSIGSRKKVLYSGLIFAVTTFVLYSAIMYGMHKLIFSTQVFLPYIATIKYIIWGLAIILWLIEIKDFFWYGKGVSLAIPKWAKPTLEYVTKKWTYMSAFVLAVLSTFVELPCTIWIPLAYVGAVGDKVNIFAALWLYNFFFILPLLIIIFGIYYGISAFKTEDGDLAINKVSNKKIMRLVAGIILITLWVLFLTKVL